MNPWSEALWLNEHGPRGGDEINIPQAGKITAGRWRRTVLTTAACPFRKQKANGSGDRTSLYVWPVSRGERDGLYSAPTFPQWQHKLFIGALKETSLIVLAVDGNQVREEGDYWRRAENASAMFAWDPTAICTF